MTEPGRDRSGPVLIAIAAVAGIIAAPFVLLYGAWGISSALRQPDQATSEASPSEVEQQLRAITRQAVTPLAADAEIGTERDTASAECTKAGPLDANKVPNGLYSFQLNTTIAPTDGETPGAIYWSLVTRLRQLGYTKPVFAIQEGDADVIIGEPLSNGEYEVILNRWENDPDGGLKMSDDIQLTVVSKCIDPGPNSTPRPPIMTPASPTPAE